MTTTGAFRGTPFQASTSARCHTTWWFGWGGYAVPDVYTDLHAEMAAIRTGASMNEMSPIPKIEIRGPDAQQCVDHLVTADVSEMGVGRARYTPWCTEEGKVVADGIVFRFSEDRFVLSGDRSETFFRQHAGRFDASIADVTDEYGILALQGPRSRRVLEAATGEGWADLGFSRVRRAEIAGWPVDVARQGFTGELGYEIWVERPDGAAVWEAVAEAGADFGVRPAGEYAIDVARVEAGLVLISADYTGAGPDPVSADSPPNPEDFVTPYELGLGHCVKLDKAADFVGRGALAAEHERGPARRIVGLDIDLGAVVGLFLDNGRCPDVSPRVRWDHLPLRCGSEVIGRASSVTWSPTASRLIGFGMVPAELSAGAAELTVDWADFWGEPLGPAPAAVCRYPFIELNRSR